ncbi:hypothetical protein A4X06_0g2580, partial [Tilletia controversa]
ATAPILVLLTQSRALAEGRPCLETANQTVALSVETLREATADFPRLAVALANKKHFDVRPRRRTRDPAVEKVERRARAAKNRVQQASAKLEQQQPSSRSTTTTGPTFIPTAFRPTPALSAEATKSLPDVSEAQLNQLRAQVEAARRRKTMLDERAKQLESEADILAACQ